MPDLSTFHPSHLATWSRPDALVSACYEFADSICQTAPYYIAQYSDTLGRVLASCGPPAFVSQWYQKR